MIKTSGQAAANKAMVSAVNRLVAQEVPSVGLYEKVDEEVQFLPFKKPPAWQPPEEQTLLSQESRLPHLLDQQFPPLWENSWLGLLGTN